MTHQFLHLVVLQLDFVLEATVDRRKLHIFLQEFSASVLQGFLSSLHVLNAMLLK